MYLTAKDIVSELHKKTEFNIELTKIDWIMLQKCVKMFNKETLDLAIASYPNRKIENVGAFFFAICKKKATFNNRKCRTANNKIDSY
jgi:hypothetical protein